jgi:hypothetical protein
MVRYQSMLCKNPQVKLKVVWTLNPVTLLLSAAGPPDHDCVEVINEVFSSCPDLVTRSLTSIASNICKQCETCAKITPNSGSSLNQESSKSPFKDLEVDFTKVP